MVAGWALRWRLAGAQQPKGVVDAVGDHEWEGQSREVVGGQRGEARPDGRGRAPKALCQLDCQQTALAFLAPCLATCLGTPVFARVSSRNTGLNSNTPFGGV